MISINKTMTKESKQMKTETFVFVVALKRAILNDSTKRGFKIFMNFLYEEELTTNVVSGHFDTKSFHYKVISMQVILIQVKVDSIHILSQFNTKL